MVAVTPIGFSATYYNLKQGSVNVRTSAFIVISAISNLFLSIKYLYLLYNYFYLASGFITSKYVAHDIPETILRPLLAITSIYIYIYNIIFIFNIYFWIVASSSIHNLRKIYLKKK